MAFRDPVLVEIERKLDEDIPLSLDDGLDALSHVAICTRSGASRADAERAKERQERLTTSSTATSTRRTSASRAARSARLRADEFKEPQRVFRMTADQVFAKAVETGTNFNQIHIVGGHDPRQLSLDYWLPLMRRFKSALPHVQLSLFTAAEIEYMAQAPPALVSATIVAMLKEAGLDNVNGGARRDLRRTTRAKICPNKVSTANWLEHSRGAAPRRASRATRRCCTDTSSRSRSASII